MKDAPAFDLYPERWTHGTRHMSKIERCDYMDLLCHQWTDDGLPADLEILARLIGYKNAKKISPLVLEKFPISDDGKRRNLRLEEERQKQRERISSKARGAAMTNAKRWGKPIASESLSDDSATPERVASESPPPTTHPHPLSTTTTTTPPARLEQVLEYAKRQRASDTTGKPITDEIAEAWFDARADSGWQERRDGHEYDIRDWQANLRKFARHWHQNPANGLHRPNAATKSAFAPRQSAFTLRQRRDELQAKLKKLNGKIFYDDESLCKGQREIADLEAEIATIDDHLKVA